jgi:hypothetical protein
MINNKKNIFTDSIFTNFICVICTFLCFRSLFLFLEKEIFRIHYLWIFHLICCFIFRCVIISRHLISYFYICTILYQFTFFASTFSLLLLLFSYHFSFLMALVILHSLLLDAFHHFFTHKTYFFCVFHTNNSLPQFISKNTFLLLTPSIYINMYTNTISSLFFIPIHELSRFLFFAQSPFFHTLSVLLLIFCCVYDDFC